MEADAHRVPPVELRSVFGFNGELLTRKHVRGCSSKVFEPHKRNRLTR